MSVTSSFDPHLDEPEAPLYAARKKIYPQGVNGVFRRTKTALLIITLGIYYFLPFLRWDRGPNAPNQALLIDLPHRRAYFSLSKSGHKKFITSQGFSLSRLWFCFS